jgi:hypothetical protein
MLALRPMATHPLRWSLQLLFPGHRHEQKGLGLRSSQLLAYCRPPITSTLQCCCAFKFSSSVFEILAGPCVSYLKVSPPLTIVVNPLSGWRLVHSCSFCRFESERLSWAQERGQLLSEVSQLQGKVQVGLVCSLAGVVHLLTQSCSTCFDLAASLVCSWTAAL